MDLRIPDMSGIDAMIAIRSEFREVRIIIFIILTTLAGDVEIQRALDAEARVYILKRVSPRELVKVIRQVHADKKRIPAEIATHLAEWELQRCVDQPGAVSARSISNATVCCRRASRFVQPEGQFVGKPCLQLGRSSLHGLSVVRITCMRALLAHVDVIRLDHFRGFQQPGIYPPRRRRHSLVHG